MAETRIEPLPISRTRNLATMWMLRILVRQGAFAALLNGDNANTYGFVLDRLKLPRPDLKARAETRQLLLCLEATLASLESRAHRLRHGRVLEDNLLLIGKTFRLNAVERSILALAVLTRANEDFHAIASLARPQVDVADQIATIIGRSSRQVRDVLSMRGNLKRSGLLDFRIGGSPTANLLLRRNSLRCLAGIRLTSLEEVFGPLLRPCTKARLSRRDYAHFMPGFDLIHGLIGEAVASRRIGVNILLHGLPGTGKSELPRTIAESLGCPLYEVSFTDEDGDSLDARARLACAATAQRLLAGRKAVLVFDEVDAIFNDGSAFFGKPTTAEQAKPWVNALLEDTPLPMVWIANNISGVDDAFLRRFDLIAELPVQPLHDRRQLLERNAGGLFNATELTRLAHTEAITPTILSRAVAVGKRVEVEGISTAKVVESVLDGILQAQGRSSVRQACRQIADADYDPHLSNADIDLEKLADGLAAAGSGRILLHGPPGTGKTAFGHWFAQKLGQPLLLKRVSDLQSPLIGIMERNLARAFQQAERERAVLQIDEVDSFLRDRRMARQAWEVAQVNEFLTQLEAFDGILIATSNLAEGLDAAALRRFDHRIRIGFLRPDQAWTLLCTVLGKFGVAVRHASSLRLEIAKIDQLTPGDFSTLERRHRLSPFSSAASVLHALRDEVAAKGGAPRRIGFV